jgi:hypothetical protein
MTEQDGVLAQQAPLTSRRAAAKRIEQRPGRPEQRTATEASTLAQLMALKRMSVNEMKAKWEALFAAPAPNNSRGYLELQIPTQAGHLFRFDRGHPSDLKPATIPI